MALAHTAGRWLDRYPRAGGAVFLCTSAVMLAVMALAARTALVSAGWPVAKGVITRAFASTVVEGGRVHQRWDFQYAYEVNGRQYLNDRVGAMTLSPDVERLQQDVGPLSVGMPLSVHYDPEHPERAVLITGLGASGLLIIIIVVVLPAMIGCICIHAAKTRRNAVGAGPMCVASTDPTYLQTSTVHPPSHKKKLNPIRFGPQYITASSAASST